MKPFILFGGAKYYPSGGVGDRIGAYLSYEEALRVARQQSELSKVKWAVLEWWHIYDTRTDSVVRWSYEDDPPVD